jgi:hypothetical protein
VGYLDRRQQKDEAGAEAEAEVEIEIEVEAEAEAEDDFEVVPVRSEHLVGRSIDLDIHFGTGWCFRPLVGWNTRAMALSVPHIAEAGQCLDAEGCREDVAAAVRQWAGLPTRKASVVPCTVLEVPEGLPDSGFFPKHGTQAASGHMDLPAPGEGKVLMAGYLVVAEDALLASDR